MNKFGYNISRLMKSVGFSDKKKHLGNANRENFLKKEAFEVLGELVWEDSRNIDFVSKHYMSLRMIENSRILLFEGIKSIEKKNMISNEILSKIQVDENLSDFLKKTREYKSNGAFLNKIQTACEFEAKKLANQQKPYFAKLGELIYRYSDRVDCPVMKDCMAEHKDLIDKIAYLDSSVNYNLSLAR